MVATEVGTKTDIKWQIFLKQVFVCITILSTYFMSGMALGTSTVAVPQIRDEANSTAAVSEEMASWVASIIPVGAMVWSYVLIAVTHHIGRKKPMIIVSLNSFCAFSLLYWSKNVLHLFFSQMINGFTLASASTVSLMCILEYSSLRFRGFFMVIKLATYSWGIWVANAIGTFFNYRYIGLFGMAVSVYTLVTLLFIPESPYWLACRKKYDQCAASHKWLKGSSGESEKELNDIITTQKELNTIVKIKKSIRLHMTDNAEVLKKPEMYKKLLICAVLFLMYHVSGKSVCSVYAIELMSKITKSKSAAYAAMLIIDGISVSGIYVSCILSKFLKRRKLLMGACSACVLFLFTISFYMYLIRISFIDENIYVTLVLLTGYTFAVCFGPIGGATTLFGELFPAKHRTLITCLYSIVSHLTYATFLRLGPYMFKTFNIHGAMLFFGIFLSILTVLMYKYAPETKGMTARELSELFKHRNNVNGAEKQLLKHTTLN